MNDLKKYTISKEDFKKCFNNKELIKWKDYIKYLEKKGIKLSSELMKYFL